MALGRNGLVRILVFLGYSSCFILVFGAVLLLMGHNVFHGQRAHKIEYLSNVLYKTPTLGVMLFASSYTFLWGCTMVLVWGLGSRRLFFAACLNVTCFNAMLSFAEQSWHFAFVVGIGLTHTVIHAVISNSRVGFLWYKAMTAVSTTCFIAFACVWPFTLGRYRHEYHVTAFCFEFMAWMLAAGEYTCMVSILHGSQYMSAGTKYDVEARGLDVRLVKYGRYRVFREYTDSAATGAREEEALLGRNVQGGGASAQSERADARSESGSVLGQLPAEWGVDPPRTSLEVRPPRPRLYPDIGQWKLADSPR